MMKLILSLTLICMLSSTVGALQCQGTVGTLYCQPDEYCATAATQIGSVGRQFRACLPSSACNPKNLKFSFNDGFLSLTSAVHCCNTTRCNNQIVPYPDVQTKNDLKCFSCHGVRSDGTISFCHKRELQCVGDQDRCFNWNVTYEGLTAPFLGCASANLCEFPTQLIGLTPLAAIVNFGGAPKCCETSFCNSAGTLKLSVAPVLLGLIALNV